MDSIYILSVFGGSALMLLLLFAVFEYRIRKPDDLILFEKQGEIRLRKGQFYPRHFSLAIKRKAHPIHLDTEVTAAGNLGIRIKLVGSAAPSLEHLDALIRMGGWNQDVVSNAAIEAQLLLEGIIKQYAEGYEIQKLSSSQMTDHLNQQAPFLQEKLGLDLISLSIQTLEPTDPQIASALRQQEQARLHEETERLSHQARAAAAKAKYQTEEEIAEMEHALELKKVELGKQRIENESILARQKLEDELERNRMRLAFEMEEVEVLKNSPELLMLTPQAARLAEASQNLKNARTVISFSPQELSQGAELLKLFQDLLQKVMTSKQNDLP
ncbi:MAG: hypothetical protein IH629_05950 [Thermoleophilia bacterium]|nr:hypothetical protein [Thermoleophilia bacterium]